MEGLRHLLLPVLSVLRLLVVWGWAMVGMLLEGYGVIALFAGFLPTIHIFLKPPGCLTSSSFRFCLR